MEIIPFLAASLGDSSYLLVSGGVAAVIDPQRDVRPYVAEAERRGVRIAFAVETHVHNDYISGARELAGRGAAVVAPAEAGLQFPHQGIVDGQEVQVGGARLRALAAPGHTYEHTAYLAIDEGGVVRGAFTGGSVLIGSAGRTDLLGPEQTERLTLLQWESAHRLALALNAEAAIMPTHGAGSFCSTSGVGEGRQATLADERARNPVLASGEFAAFRAVHLSALPPIPGYYRHMAPINRAGPRVYGEPPAPAELSPEALRATAAQIIDVRNRVDYARGHVPRSLLIEEENALLAYLGWLVAFGSPLALVSYDAGQAERVAVDLLRIGYEDVRGYVPFAAWRGGGGEVATLRTVAVPEARELLAAARTPVLDVRFTYEIESTPVPGALARPIDAMPSWAADAPDGALVVCASGQRAATVGSYLLARGKQPVVLIDGGAAELRAPAAV